MSRRNAGLASLQRSNDSSYSTLSTSLSLAQTSILSAQLATFQSSLSTFSTHHRAKILSSPEFRAHFSQLCAEIGVDPLGGGAKGMWDKMGMGDWYYALGIQVVDVCLAARERGGGLIALEQVLHAVTLLRKGGDTLKKGGEISENDVKRAIETLEPLGCGYAVIEVGGVKVVRCSPGGLDKDSLIVIEVATATGRGSVTAAEVWEHTRTNKVGNWTFDRVQRALERSLMEDGMVWLDEQSGSSTTQVRAGQEYWVPALFDFS